jgi:peptidoglycan biosynthesis protein MviN/MurJ (putative lipid II flippase)
LFASGFDSQTVNLTARLLRIIAPSLLFMVWVSVFGGYLQTNREFLAPAAISLPRNFAILPKVKRKPLTFIVKTPPYIKWEKK